MTMPFRSARANLLADLAAEVRNKTLQLLAWARPSELTWAPPGTANHVLWHAGHAVWLQDALTIQRITGRSELPAGWSARFGMGSRPDSHKTDWPRREEVYRQLEDQLPRLRQLLSQVTDTELAAVPPGQTGRDERTLEQCIAHAIHDEANHQGEMYLLLKLRRLGTG